MSYDFLEDALAILRQDKQAQFIIMHLKDGDPVATMVADVYDEATALVMLSDGIRQVAEDVAMVTNLDDLDDDSGGLNPGDLSKQV